MRTFDIHYKNGWLFHKSFGKRGYKIVKMKKLRLGQPVKAKLRSFKSSFVNWQQTFTHLIMHLIMY